MNISEPTLFKSIDQKHDSLINSETFPEPILIFWKTFPENKVKVSRKTNQEQKINISGKL